MKRAIVTVGLLCAVGGIGLYKSFAGPSAPAPEASPLPRISAAMHACDGKQPTIQCSVARGEAEAYLIERIEQSSLSETPDVLAALDLDEPAVQLEALDRLGESAVGDPKQFPTAQERIVRLMIQSPYVCVGDRAADLLETTSAFKDIGKRWHDHHARFSQQSLIYWKPMTRPDLRKLGLQPYPGATANTVGDSDRSLGFFTKDSVEKVVAFYSKGGARVVAPATWQAWMMERMQHQSSPGGGPSAADIEQMRTLADEFRRTHDPKIAQQIAELGKKQRAQQRGPVVPHSSMLNEPYLYHAAGDATAIITSATPDHLATMVFVYPEPELQGVMIELAWNLDDAPSLAVD